MRISDWSSDVCSSDLDAAMIKDNHIAVAGGVGEAVRRALAGGIAEVIVEVDRLAQIEPALEAGATRLLLDNMYAPMQKQAVALVTGRVPTEERGGVRLDNIRASAKTCVTYISLVRIRHTSTDTVLLYEEHDDR